MRQHKVPFSHEDYCTDVIKLQYSDGAEFRQANPYPDWNDPCVKQDNEEALETKKCLFLISLTQRTLNYPRFNLDNIIIILLINLNIYVCLMFYHI